MIKGASEEISEAQYCAKKCSKCEEVKPYDDFYKNKINKDGYKGQCKKCAGTYNKEWYELNPGKSKEYKRAQKSIDCHKAYLKTPTGKKSKKAASTRYKKNNPIKMKASTKSWNAIKGGHLIRLPCEICGNIVVHGHHDDYSKPLDVRWLCPPHHKEWHELNGPGING